MLDKLDLKDFDPSNPANIKALLIAHHALLVAFAMTHPNPADLREKFGLFMSGLVEGAAHDDPTFSGLLQGLEAQFRSWLNVRLPPKST